MKTVAADVLAWVLLGMTAFGFLGGCGLSAYAQWLEGFDSGAPFSFFAGIKMLEFMLRHPPTLILFGIGVLGVLGLSLIAPYTSSRRVTPESPELEQVRRNLEAAQSLTTAYSKILQTPSDHFWPLSALPADKETMKAALKMDAAFQASQGALDKPLEGEKATLRDTFISTYAMTRRLRARRSRVADGSVLEVHEGWR